MAAEMRRPGTADWSVAFSRKVWRAHHRIGAKGLAGPRLAVFEHILFAPENVEGSTPTCLFDTPLTAASGPPAT
jgi:hypothetical protein